jgi:hypothetical protein
MEINFKIKLTSPDCSLVVRNLAMGKQQSGNVSTRVGVVFVKNGFIKLKLNMTQGKKYLKVAKCARRG